MLRMLRPPVAIQDYLIVSGECFWKNVSLDRCLGIQSGHRIRNLDGGGLGIHEIEFAYAPTLEKAFNFFFKEDRKRLRHEFDRARQTGKRFSVDLRLHTPLENYYWVRIIGQAEFENGEAVRVFSIIKDITLSKWLQIDLTEQLQGKAYELYQKNRFLQETKELVVESEKGYRRLADKVPFAIVLINDDDFLYTNPRWEEFDRLWHERQQGTAPLH